MDGHVCRDIHRQLRINTTNQHKAARLACQLVGFYRYVWRSTRHFLDACSTCSCPVSFFGRALFVPPTHNCPTPQKLRICPIKKDRRHFPCAMSHRAGPTSLPSIPPSIPYFPVNVKCKRRIQGYQVCLIAIPPWLSHLFPSRTSISSTYSSPSR